MLSRSLAAITAPGPTAWFSTGTVTRKTSRPVTRRRAAAGSSAGAETKAETWPLRSIVSPSMAMSGAALAGMTRREAGIVELQLGVADGLARGDLVQQLLPHRVAVDDAARALDRDLVVGRARPPVERVLARGRGQPVGAIGDARAGRRRCHQRIGGTAAGIGENVAEAHDRRVDRDCGPEALRQRAGRQCEERGEDEC